MIKKLIFFAFFLVNLGFIQAQELNWVSMDQAQALAAKENKKIMVKVYTNWCGWCKEMDKSTFPNKKLAKVLNDNYIVVKFNAEQKEDLSWNGKNYKLVRTKGGSYHELAAEWLDGKLSYPTVVFLDEKGNRIQAIPGYRKPLELEKIAAYFGGNHHTKSDWTAFEKNYK